jgi:glycosyltransferase involved in cell wall biosynthesis
VPRLKYESAEAVRAAQRARYVYHVFRATREPIDAILLAEFNQGLCVLASALARSRNIPLITDFLVSLYDVAVINRKTLAPRRPRAVFRRSVDRLAIALSDRLVIDTRAQAEYYEDLYGGVLEKASIIPIGAVDWESHSAIETRDWSPDVVNVLFFGYYSPLHGVETIIDAANMVARDPRFRFYIVGTGQMSPALSATPAPPNVTFREPVAPSVIEHYIAEADICLGVFGTTGSAGRVVPNKVWQCLARGKPVISRNGPGPESILEDGRDCLLVPAGNPGALAESLNRLARSPSLRERLGRNGATLVRTEFASHKLGGDLVEVIADAIAQRRKHP